MKSNFKFAMRHIAVAMMVVGVATSCSESEDEKSINNYYQDNTINSIAAVATSYYDGLATFSAESSKFVYWSYFTSEEVSTLELRYRINPTDASIAGIEWGLISRDMEYTARAEGDNVLGDVELTVVSYENGELVLSVDGIELEDGDTYPVFAIVAKYSDTKQVVSDFCYIEESLEPTEKTVTDVKLESADGLKLYTDYEQDGDVTNLTTSYTFDLGVYGDVGEDNWMSFEDLGFTCSTISYSLTGADADDFQINDGVLSLTGGDYDAADRSVIVTIKLMSNEDTVKTYYMTFSTKANEQVFEAVDDEGIYYTDGDNYNDLVGSEFADYANNSDYDYYFYSDSSYESAFTGTNSVSFTNPDYFTYSVDKSNLSTGSNYLYIRFVNRVTGKVYVYVYIIYVSAVPTNVEPAVSTSVETFGYFPESGYMQTQLASYFTNEESVTSNDENVTFKVYLTGTNASKATLYNNTESTGVDSVTGTLKNFYSTIKDYTVRLNSSLSNDDMAVSVMVDIMRTGVEAESTDEGTVTFKNPISLTTGTNYAFNDNSCNMSTGVVVKFMTDTNTEGAVVYQEGTYTGDHEMYGITVGYTTETDGLSVKGTMLSGETEGTFNVSVKAEMYDNIFASKAQSYIKVSYNK